MDLNKKWKSVADGDPIPSKEIGTFRNVDCSGWTSESIDKMDSFCMNHSISRREYIDLLLDNMEVALEIVSEEKKAAIRDAISIVKLRYD
jgi:hypothetical protein